MENSEDIEIETLLERMYRAQALNRNGDAKKSQVRTPEEFERIWDEILAPDDS